MGSILKMYILTYYFNLIVSQKYYFKNYHKLHFLIWVKSISKIVL